MKSLRHDEVFTPRGASITDMYIDRTDIENKMSELFTGEEIGYLTGISGSGKTWLYKKVFKDLECYYIVLSLDLDYTTSIKELIAQFLGNSGVEKKKGSKRSLGAGLGFPWASAKTDKQTEFVYYENDIIKTLVSYVRSKAGKAPACIVFENVEQAMRNTQFLRDLSPILLSASQDFYADKAVKFLLVSTIDDLKIRLAKVPAVAPLVTRIRSFEIASSFTRV